MSLDFERLAPFSPGDDKKYSPRTRLKPIIKPSSQTPRSVNSREIARNILPTHILQARQDLAPPRHKLAIGWRPRRRALDDRRDVVRPVGHDPNLEVFEQRVECLLGHEVEGVRRERARR
ncbi:unnamed protein product [Diplocarpon coronariae]|nr:hypothetical protein JHW43_008528 [Diplocarpon mali]